MSCQTNREDHGQIANALFSSQKDFIVIGLCGKTGSGATTAAEILQKEFEELQLRNPDYSESDLFSSHEYRILYTFAQKNWRRFYNIKTSALITAHVLRDQCENFYRFLIELLGEECAEIQAACAEFFESEMEFDLRDWFEIAPDDIKRGVYQNWLNSDCIGSEMGKPGWDLTIHLEKGARRRRDRVQTEIREDAGPFQDGEFLLDGKRIGYRYVEGKPIFRLRNQDLYQVFLEYKHHREEKTGFKNPIYFWIMKKYIFTFLPDQAAKLWAAIGEQSIGLPTIAMQFLGINLRISREPYLGEKSFQKDGYAAIAEDINLAIKLLRSYQFKWYSYLDDAQKQQLGSEAHKHTLVVVDSIKNPFESRYLKQRYSNYYLVGIYTEDSEREKRLEWNQKFTRKDIEEIDQIEQLSEFKKEYRKLEHGGKTEKKRIVPLLVEQVKSRNLFHILPFILQNVASCLDSADIFINNKQDNDARLYLKETLLRYVCLIMYPGLVVPTALERCMQIAYTAKANSGCLSRQVGAVITDRNFHLLSIGWNQQPEEELPCTYRDLCEVCHHWAPSAYSNYENDDTDEFQKSVRENVLNQYDNPQNPLREHGRLPHYCFKDIYNRIKKKDNQVYTRALHGEETAFLNLAPAQKEAARGGCLFTTSSPCELCAKKAKYMGIARIYYVEPYAGISHGHVLCAGPAESRPEFILLTGAVGRAYMQLYTPLLPLKDEHELWMGGKVEDILQIGKREDGAQDGDGKQKEEEEDRRTAGKEGL